MLARAVNFHISGPKWAFLASEYTLKWCNTLIARILVWPLSLNEHMKEHTMRFCQLLKSLNTHFLCPFCSTMNEELACSISVELVDSMWDFCPRLLMKTSTKTTLDKQMKKGGYLQEKKIAFCWLCNQWEPKQSNAREARWANICWFASGRQIAHQSFARDAIYLNTS